MIQIGWFIEISRLMKEMANMIKCHDDHYDASQKIY